MHPSFHKGAAAEYAVASWYLENGYQVWWPSIQQDSIDFLTSKAGKVSRVQVKVAQWLREKGNRAPGLRVTLQHGAKAYKRTAFDLLAAVDGDRIWIFPFKLVYHLSSIRLETPGVKRRLKNLNADDYRVQ